MVAMRSDDQGSEPSLRLEAIERRGELRGILPGVTVTLPDGRRCEVLEASRKGVFVNFAEPDALALGAAFEITIERGTRRFSCRTEVIRKELEPRCGIALRIVYITPSAEEMLEAMLAEA